MFLRREQRKQRGCKPLTEKQEEGVWSRLIKINGKARLTDISLGGGNGTYEGKWWSWSVDDLKAMLDKAGFTYEDGPDVEYMMV